MKASLHMDVDKRSRVAGAPLGLKGSSAPQLLRLDTVRRGRQAARAALDGGFI